ncbi:hypothetical protein JWG45_13570 [Leptospira sp. 201903070]|uniref:Uncharacterized protein n=1 Tax=Leptospira ainlahdjerensis TaxID=2810033 RepID=A0ABS2UCU0_9LEPT|nr:hypothetical protein [Leptospira ainlahdjerensis]MBM9578181.1 hypothetical protein [Leptospira ainlahdjerensis]
MKHIDSNLLNTILSGDIKDYYESSVFQPNRDSFQKHVSDSLDFPSWDKQAVLGLDIYRYSKMEELSQTLVPIIFDLIYQEASRHVLLIEPIIFQNYDEERFSINFISTGDGGFQIFDNPLQAVIFAMAFQNLLHLFNTFHFYPNLRSIFEPLTLRYCLTFDHIYQYRENFYGRAIITNARIMSLDVLNRFLLDESAMLWFATTFNGIESIRITRLPDVARRLNLSIGENPQSLYFSTERTPFSFNDTLRIPMIISQKIGIHSPKGDVVNVHNLYLQYLAHFSDETDQSKNAAFVMTIGNTNPP